MEKKEVAVNEIKTDMVRKKRFYIKKWVGIGMASGEEDGNGTHHNIFNCISDSSCYMINVIVGAIVWVPSVILIMAIILGIILFTGVSTIYTIYMVAEKFDDEPNYYADTLYQFSNQKDNYSYIFPYNAGSFGNYSTNQKECFGTTIGKMYNYRYTVANDVGKNTCYKVKVNIRFDAIDIKENMVRHDLDHIFEKCYYSSSEVESNETINQYFDLSKPNEELVDYKFTNPWDIDLPLKYNSVSYYKIVYDVQVTGVYKIITDEDIFYSQDYWNEDSKSSCYITKPSCEDKDKFYTEDNRIRNKTCITMRDIIRLGEDENEIDEDKYKQLVTDYDREEVLKNIKFQYVYFAFIRTVVVILLLVTITVILGVSGIFAAVASLFCWCPKFACHKDVKRVYGIDTVHKCIYIPNDNICIICLEKEVCNKIFSGCNHNVCCNDCIKNVTKCPCCREESTVFSYN